MTPFFSFSELFSSLIKLTWMRGDVYAFFNNSEWRFEAFFCHTHAPFFFWGTLFLRKTLFEKLQYLKQTSCLCCCILCVLCCSFCDRHVTNTCNRCYKPLSCLCVAVQMWEKYVKKKPLKYRFGFTFSSCLNEWIAEEIEYNSLSPPEIFLYSIAVPH